MSAWPVVVLILESLSSVQPLYNNSNKWLSFNPREESVMSNIFVCKKIGIAGFQCNAIQNIGI